MTLRISAAIAAMVTVLTVAWLIISPLPQGDASSPLRLILSIILIFGIAFLAACLALILNSKAQK